MSGAVVSATMKNRRKNNSQQQQTRSPQPDLSDKMAIRALYNTALETKRNIADAAIKNQQAIIKSKQISLNRKGNNPTNAKDAWGV